MGNQSLVLERGFLQCTPYLYLLTDQRCSENRTSFSLPQRTEFQNDLSLLQDLIIFSMNPPEQFVLPSYQRLFQLVRLADFIGCEKFLEMVAGRLGVAVLAINNANAIRTVRGLIRLRYRAHSKFIDETFEKGNKCAKCNTSVAACWRYAAAATQT